MRFDEDDASCPVIPYKFTEVYHIKCEWFEDDIYRFTIPRYGYVAEIVISEFVPSYAATLYIHGKQVWQNECIKHQPYTIPYNIHMLEIPWPQECVLYVHGRSPTNVISGQEVKLTVTYDIQKEHHLVYFRKTFGEESYQKLQQVNIKNVNTLQAIQYRTVKLGANRNIS